LGQHFPEPLFHGVFQLVEQRVVGERHLKVVLKSECGSVKLDGIAFGIDRDIWPNPTMRGWSWPTSSTSTSSAATRPCS
jgi:single-stranded-DNA-specific exonuclease